MANKTVPTQASVDEFVAAVPNEGRREDSRRLIDLMSRISGEPPVMWGPSIIGFGHYRYRYESGREGEAGLLGFSPRARELTLYFADGIARYSSDLAELGPHRTGKVCLYLKSLDAVDLDVLTRMLTRSHAEVAARDGSMGRAE